MGTISFDSKARRLARLMTSIGTIAIIANYIATHYKLFVVQSSSMLPEYCVGDFLLLAKRSEKKITRVGDIVVIQPPGANIPAVKRVVALSGQRIRLDSNLAIVDQHEVQGEVYKCDRNGAGRYEQRSVAFKNSAEILVPPGAVFVMGDNRNESRDSRTFGPVGTDQIIGYVVFRIPPITVPIRHCTCTD